MKTPVSVAKFILDEIFALRSYLRSVTNSESGEFTRHADLDVVEEHLHKIEKSLGKLRFRNCDRFDNIDEAIESWSRLNPKRGGEVLTRPFGTAWEALPFDAYKDCFDWIFAVESPIPKG